MSLPDLFKQWLDSVLRNDIPSDVVALCFNIYENENKVWSVEVVGTSSFDENDDWVGDEITVVDPAELSLWLCRRGLGNSMCRKIQLIHE